MRSRRSLFLIVLVLFVAVTFGIAYGQDSTRIRLKEPRIAPLGEQQWTEQQQKLLAPVKNQTGRVINIFSTIVRNPLLYERWMAFGIYILAEQGLPPRDREILILRIGWLCQSEYEFGQHTLVGKGVGLKDEEIFRITKGPDDSGWSRIDAALIRATDELHKDAFITDATWKTLSERYNEKQLMDIIFTVGQYNLVSMALNSLGVQREPGVPGFPKEGAAAAQGKKQFAYAGPPAFVLEYPDSFEKDPLQPNEVLRAKAPGGVPVFEILVFDPPKEGGKLEDHGKNYAKLLATQGTEVKILSQKPAKLKDGLLTQEFTIEWKYNGTFPILSLVVAVMKENKMVSFGGHVMGGDLTPMREIVQTWEFK
ncbi:MAG: carboxymuconolactone decarboxylase family protein [Deltaproteobacteria bacterium]|nr:carboxymuconolactone decarboxylase family protein [Deltaproteobacteria bacterium]